LVFQLASEGDSVSKEILSRKGRTQGEMLNGVLTKSNMLGKKFPVVLGGSIYKGNSPEFIDAFKSTVLEQSPQATFHMAELEPVAGAYLFGLDRVNVTLDDNAFLKLKKSLSL
jgi:N-acetylglucosamine kinase-like BadF-type ATPase